MPTVVRGYCLGMQGMILLAASVVSMAAFPPLMRRALHVARGFLVADALLASVATTLCGAVTVWAVFRASIAYAGGTDVYGFLGWLSLGVSMLVCSAVAIGLEDQLRTPVAASDGREPCATAAGDERADPDDGFVE